MCNPKKKNNKLKYQAHNLLGSRLLTKWAALFIHIRDEGIIKTDMETEICTKCV